MFVCLVGWVFFVVVVVVVVGGGGGGGGDAFAVVYPAYVPKEYFALTLDFGLFVFVLLFGIDCLFVWWVGYSSLLLLL